MLCLTIDRRKRLSKQKSGARAFPRDIMRLQFILEETWKSQLIFGETQYERWGFCILHTVSNSNMKFEQLFIPALFLYSDVFSNSTQATVFIATSFFVVFETNLIYRKLSVMRFRWLRNWIWSTIIWTLVTLSVADDCYYYICLPLLLLYITFRGAKIKVSSLSRSRAYPSVFINTKHKPSSIC